jgi:methionine aminotransferase
MYSPVSSIHSKLPQVGTTIFTRMSQLAQQHDALNLAQGFPEFDCQAQLQFLVNKYMQQHHNQYAPMGGVMMLREMIANKVFLSSQKKYNPETEITITSGATEALFVAISTVVHPGDEVIIFEPAYDSYVPVIELQGGLPIYITLDPIQKVIDWDGVRGKITSKTKAIILNTPQNPTGQIWSKSDLEQLGAIAEQHDLVVISDEVYEHIVFDGAVHHSAAEIPTLANRTFLCSSFGKTFHITGWKIGYCLAPASWTAEFRKIHQFLVFSVATPFQYAIAEYLLDPSHYQQLASFYERKRVLFCDALSGTGFEFTKSEGSFFQNVSYHHLSDEDDLSLAERLTREVGVASIPVSAFYHAPTAFKVLRFCFAKQDTTLIEAANRLRNINW